MPLRNNPAATDLNSCRQEAKGTLVDFSKTLALSLSAFALVEGEKSAVMVPKRAIMN
jgi:hypothetical protein